MSYFFFLIVVLITNAIQAITGFAGTLLAMPPSILLIGADDARAILNFIAFLTCLIIVLGSRQDVRWKILGKILVLMALGMVVGIWLYRQVQLDILLYFYGGVIILIALYKLFNKSKDKDLSPAVQVLILLVAGVIHGMFVSGGALLVVYAASVLKEKNEFRATVAAVWVVLNGAMFFTEAIGQMYTLELTAFALIACIPALAGVFIGGRLQKHIGKEAFMKATYVLLLISGAICFI